MLLAFGDLDACQRTGQCFLRLILNFGIFGGLELFWRPLFGRNELTKVVTGQAEPAASKMLSPIPLREFRGWVLASVSDLSLHLFLGQHPTRWQRAQNSKRPDIGEDLIVRCRRKL